MKILLFPLVLGFLPPGGEREATKTRRNRLSEPLVGSIQLFKSILEKFSSSRLAFSARCYLSGPLLPSFLSSRVRSISYRFRYLEEKRRWEIEADRILKMDLNDVPRFSGSSVLRHCRPLYGSLSLSLSRASFDRFLMHAPLFHVYIYIYVCIHARKSAENNGAGNGS